MSLLPGGVSQTRVPRECAQGLCWDPSHPAGPVHTAFLADEGPLGSLWDALPHGDGLGVAGVRGPPLLAVAPVLLAFEEIGLAHGFPAQSRVNAFSGQTAAQLPQAVGVPRLHRHLLKHPVLVTCGQEKPRISLPRSLSAGGCASATCPSSSGTEVIHRAGVEQGNSPRPA